MLSLALKYDEPKLLTHASSVLHSFFFHSFFHVAPNRVWGDNKKATQTQKASTENQRQNVQVKWKNKFYDLEYVFKYNTDTYKNYKVNEFYAVDDNFEFYKAICHDSDVNFEIDTAICRRFFIDAMMHEMFHFDGEKWDVIHSILR